MLVTSSIHNHCTFCDGAHTPEEMIESAIKAGFTDFGLSSHSPIEISPVTWSMKDEDGYFKYVNAIKSKYADKIRVYCGLEVDYYTKDRRDRGYDYLIDSVHMIYKDGVFYSVDHSAEVFEKSMIEGFGGSGLKMSHAYYDVVCKLIEEKSPTVLCHFDLVTKFNDGNKFFDEGDKKYLDKVYSSLQLALEKDCIIEVNYGAIARGCKTTPYPAGYLLPFLKEKGAKLLIGGDCHNKNFVDFGFREGVELLRSYGIKSVWQFIDGKYKEKGI